MTETELHLPDIIIKRDQLAGGMLYRLKVTATPEHGPAGSVAYQCRTNAPPHSGQCTVSPRSGEALKTNFAFNCTGWQVSGNHELLQITFIQQRKFALKWKFQQESMKGKTVNPPYDQ